MNSPTAAAWPGAPSSTSNHGRTTGSVTTWHALAHAFNVPIEHLLGTLCDNHAPPGMTDA